MHEKLKKNNIPVISFDFVKWIDLYTIIVQNVLLFFHLTDTKFKNFVQSLVHLRLLLVKSKSMFYENMKFMEISIESDIVHFWWL